ncbi:hypothetical protein TrRE_jg5599, partial [Triparma retinervis]
SAHETCLSVRFTYGTAFADTHNQLHHAEVEEHKLREHEELRRFVDEIKCPKTGKKVDLKDHHEIDTIRHLDDGVYPPKPVVVPPFAIDRTSVTNAEYASFVSAKSWTTAAEKNGWSYVLDSLVHSSSSDHLVDPHDGHWTAVPGAYWRNPLGPGSNVSDIQDHPVVHVNHRDAAEYCRWRGKRLPGDREFEAAARGGRWEGHYRYEWGDEWVEGRANVWDGDFPSGWDGEAERGDPWKSTSPVKWGGENGVGCYGMIGNVWEWCRGGRKKERPLR